MHACTHQVSQKNKEKRKKKEKKKKEKIPHYNGCGGHLSSVISFFNAPLNPIIPL